MRTRDDSNVWQQWTYKMSSNGDEQLVNVGSNATLSVWGLSSFELGEENGAGYMTIRATGGLIYDVNWKKQVPPAWDRGWSTNEGQRLNVWNEHGATNQRWKFDLVNANTK